MFGALVTAGLYWIGVPYAALWGGFTAVLRFVPYVGTLLSVLMPAALAFATFPGWAETVQTIALFLTLDFVTAWFIEPLVFGRRTGVSSFALLISALFWIWVWGPVGLLLATPLTVCIAVLGRNVRSLRFLAVIFAEEPALTPHIRFYQRLLARDEDEAALASRAQARRVGHVGVIHEVLLPALMLVSQHRSQNEITEEDAVFILDVINETVLQMASGDESLPVAPVIGLAARTPEDQTALEMLRAAVGCEVDDAGPARPVGRRSGERRDRATPRRCVHRRDLADARCGGAQLLPPTAQRSAGDESDRAAATGARRGHGAIFDAHARGRRRHRRDERQGGRGSDRRLACRRAGNARDAQERGSGVGRASARLWLSD